MACQSFKRLLWIGKDRKTKTLLRFIRWFDKERARALIYICSDMWKSYLRVVAQKAKQPVHIPDRFHIMAQLNQASAKVRAKEGKRPKAQGHEPTLTMSRWLLQMQPEDLPEKQEIKLAEPLQYFAVDQELPVERAISTYLIVVYRIGQDGFWINGARRRRVGRLSQQWISPVV